MFSFFAAAAFTTNILFSAKTVPAVDGLAASVAVQRMGDEWRLEVTAENRTASPQRFQLALSAEPRLVASRYLIPGVLYNGNEFVGKSVPAYERQYSLEIPTGWQKDGAPWIFEGDRCSIPACTISENERDAFALFALDCNAVSLAASCSMEKLPDGSFRHLVYWPYIEAPVSYTDKRTFTERYDTYLTLAPGEKLTTTAYACRGTPPWKNYGFAAVFPVAWRVLKHETPAQRSVAEVKRLDRIHQRWCRRKEKNGVWFSGFMSDIVQWLAHSTKETPRSRDGYTIADIEQDFSRTYWATDEMKQAKNLKSGEYIRGHGKDIGFASQSFQMARLAIAEGLETGHEEDVEFGLAVFRSWIRMRFKSTGHFFFPSYRNGKWIARPERDASNVGWAISELSRTVQMLKAHGRSVPDLEAATKKAAAAVLKTVRADGNLGSIWDFKTGEVKSWGGDSGGFVLMGLLRYWQLTREPEVKAVVDRALDYYYTHDIDNFVCNGGAMDCASVDREGIHPFLTTTLALYEETKNEKYLVRAHKAAWYFLSWLYLQNPEYGPETDFSIYNWKPAGSTIVGTEHPALDDYGDVLIPEFMALARIDGNPLWREVAGLVWRNGTQGFADETRRIWHTLERPVGSKQEAWFPTRWSKYRTGERKRGHINDHITAWGGTYRLASLMDLSAEDLDWLERTCNPKGGK